MALVGIIANPASGRDIRRLVAHGSVFDNYEKIRIVKRIVLGLQAAGVEEVVFMPDYFCIGRTAVEDLRLELRISYLDMLVRGDQQDSVVASGLMAEMGAGCIVTLGGDGTNRVVASGCGDVPLMPVSTGTNNVFPFMLEGTVAGLAAGVVARGAVPLGLVTERTKRLDVLRDGDVVDLALIDAVVYDDRFAGSRAIWDMSKVRAIVLSRAVPGSIGLSSVGAGLHCSELGAEHGVYLEVGPGPIQVSAPIAPGIIEPIEIAGYRRLEIGDTVEVTSTPSMLALDGEREMYIPRDARVSIRLSDRGPRVVDAGKALYEAARLNILASGTSGPESPNGTCLLLARGVCSAPCETCAKSEHS